ncbi:MAG: hypothetical protein J7M25_08530 [Deltaproteobacteria bacterium]|nr:hypothetical protein [Deltaproteobacteria bacterium]
MDNKEIFNAWWGLLNDSTKQWQELFDAQQFPFPGTGPSNAEPPTTTGKKNGAAGGDSAASSKRTHGVTADQWQALFSQWQERFRTTMDQFLGQPGAGVASRAVPGMELWMELGRMWLDAATAAKDKGPAAWTSFLESEGIKTATDLWRKAVGQLADHLASMPLGSDRPATLLRALASMTGLGQTIGQNLATPWLQAFDDLNTAWSDTLRGDHKAFQVFVHQWRDAYDESFGRLFRAPAMGMTREYQERLLRSFDAYVEYLIGLQEFVAVLDKVGADAGRRWIAHLTALKTDEGLPTHRDLYRRWVDIFETTYNEVFQTPEYAKLQARLVDSALRFKRRLDQAVEDLFKALPIPTDSEMADLYKAVYDLKKLVRSQNDRIEMLERQIAQFHSETQGGL